MHPRQNALRAAFPHTIPIMTGFLVLGAAYGVLMSTAGYSVWWSVLMSAVVFAGSMQFASVSLLTAPFDPIGAFFLALMVNARHLFYGISLLEKYRDMGAKKPFLIFGLCDETFSVVCSTDPPEGVDKGWFYFFVTLLDYLYWVAGSAIGGLLGAALPFDTKGIEFAMTALFVVIFLNQWEEQKGHLPALVGMGAAVLCLLLFGSGNFILPAMALILVLLTLLRPRIAGKEAQ